MLSRSNHGFTLIELLIAMAVIGILSSIILGSINTARGKSSDSKVKAQLSSLRSAAEGYFDANGGTYGSSASDDCLTSDFFSDAASGMLQATTQDNYPADATLSCHTDGSNYAVSALLIGAGGGQAWCVDSAGASKLIPNTLGAGVVICP